MSADDATAARGKVGVDAAATPRSSGADRRELLMFALAVVAGGIIVFVLLLMRAGSSSGVSAAVDAASRPSPAQSAAPKKAAILHTWSVENRAQWVGNTKLAAAFELQAENVVQTWFGPVRPSLVVRCMSRSVKTFVYTGTPTKIEPGAIGKTVTVGIDDQPVKTERWEDADDHDGLFAPDGAAFTERLLGAHTLRFGYSPSNSNDVVAHFSVSGLAGLIEPAAKECGWKK